MARRWLDPERLAWLRAEYPRHTVAETLRLFNARFGADVSVSQLRGASKNHKLGRALRPTSLTFDAREEAWLRERLPQAPRADVATAFFAEFGWRPRSVSLDSYASRHGLRGAPNTGRFRPGLAPHNKGRKGRCPPGSEKGWFRKGSLPSGTRPLYAERWSDRKEPRRTWRSRSRSATPTPAPRPAGSARPCGSGGRPTGPCPRGTSSSRWTGTPPTASSPTSTAFRARCWRA